MTRTSKAAFDRSGSPQLSASSFQTKRAKSTPYWLSSSLHFTASNLSKAGHPTSAYSRQPCNATHRAFIALGSNIGDRIGWIEKACRSMNERGIRVTRTSALYETEPMYVEDQDSFVNGVCEVQTSLDPGSLLKELKAIEAELGRQKTIDKGPRNIDLDILLYGEETVKAPDLSIPHPSMLEREFVLRPLCDLIPAEKLGSHTFQQYLDLFPESAHPLSPLTPLSSQLESNDPLRISSLSPTRKTHTMAILNLTPDSFSDGGVYDPNLIRESPDHILSTIDSFEKSGATILDIGGQSTRPFAPQISPQQELSNILPTIKHIRKDPRFASLAISVDTYRANVALAAITSGADIINDVSAGAMDPEMLFTAATLGCTIILMHMRGTPNTMTSLTGYPDGIIKGIATELLTRVHAAEAAGIHRWRIILDPGIGFAKTAEQNLEILRHFGELRDWPGLRGFPWLVGSSRKGFIGKITGVQEPRERIWGTAATVAAAVQGGADIVRVHDVDEMAKVARMGDAIWRV